MASAQSRLLDRKYLNWLKGTLSLLYMKEGIEDIIDTEAVRFHGILLQNLNKQGTVAQNCDSCTPRSIKKDVRRQVWYMPCVLCDPWLKEIVKNHTDSPCPNLRPENTDPQLWPIVPYEVFKAYMPYGCQVLLSANDADVQGILCLIKNCSHFTKCGRIGQVHLINELLEFRNSLFHSGNFLVDDAALQVAQQTMLGFLRGMKSLSAQEQHSVEQAVKKITMLQRGLLDLSLNKGLELQALKQKQNALAIDLNSVAHELAATSEKVSTTEDAVNTISADLEASNAKRAKPDLTEKIMSVEERLKKLQAVQDSFNRYLQANDLAQDMARLSALEHHDKRIKNLETQTQHFEVTTKQQEGEIATLYQRQRATDTELQERLQVTQAQRNMLDTKQNILDNVMTALQEKLSRFQAQRNMLDTHQGRIEQDEARLQNQAIKENKEITYEDITAMQRRLKHYYRTMCLTVPNPVVSEKLDLDRLYVDLDIKVLRETTDPHTGLENVQDQQTTANMSQCRHLFYSKDNKCRQIYITGDAGLGKSMFCKHLVDLWCKADNEIVTNIVDRDSESCVYECSVRDSILSKVSDSEVSDSEDSNSWSSDNEDAIWPLMEDKAEKRMEEDRRIMSEFKLLFYITLRESPDQYHVADMIDSQILQKDEEMQHLKASVLLKKVPCLVIIDGLDEWVCPADAKITRFVKPGIPGRDWLNTSNVFLTTTRPWKFDVLQLTSKEVDKHVELVGFNSNASVVTLCLKITELLKRKEQVQRIKGNLHAELRRLGLSHLSNIPVILTQLVCLWFDKQHISKSQTQLYCSMLEMLLKRADINTPKQTCASETACDEIQLPECFLNHEHCQTYHILLVKLGKVAFEALFNQKREQALVFESSQMGILGVDHINVDLCLKSGILSQSKVLGKWSGGSEKKLSFLHKSLQEFLAAVFLTCANEESIISSVKQFCTSVESMLEMSQVWMFLSGINCHVAKQLLTNLMTGVALKDSRLQQYRQTLTGYKSPALAQSIQTCIQACVEEATCNGHNDLCLPLEDFVINKRTISTCLERLLTYNTAAIKSVYICTTYMEPDTVERVMCQLQDTQCLQKLYLVDMQPLCKTLDNNKDSLTCLQLVNITLTTELCDAMCLALTHVTALGLKVRRLTHKQIEQLFLSVSQAQQIRQLQLVFVCTDHGGDCRARIDLSGLTQLCTLQLLDMYIARLPVMTACLESVELRHVTISESQLRQFIHALSSTSYTVEVELRYVRVTEVSDKPLDLNDLKHNPKLVVTQCQYIAIYNTWVIEFHTKQQTTFTSETNV